MPDDGFSRKIELQKREVEDMLGRVPGWITRNGMILFFILLGLLIFGSWVFKYPDIKRARILITSANPAADIQARTSGKITDLFVSDNGIVKAGDVMAMIENPAFYEDILRLKSGVLYIDTIAIEDVAGDLPDLRNAQLGTVQTDYSIFLKAYRDYIEFRRLDYHQRRIELLTLGVGPSERVCKESFRKGKDCRRGVQPFTAAGQPGCGSLYRVGGLPV